jgi:hypothetical protein
MFDRFQPRPLTVLGIQQVAGYRVKRYAIRLGDGPIDMARFDAGWDLVPDILPRPAIAAERPGVGFAILHQGRTGDYVILSWWDQQNELPTRILVRDLSGWRSAESSESFCVWDLRVMWWEREAYVNSILAGLLNAAEAYLEAIIEGYA